MEVSLTKTIKLPRGAIHRFTSKDDLFVDTNYTPLTTWGMNQDGTSLYFYVDNVKGKEFLDKIKMVEKSLLNNIPEKNLRRLEKIKNLQDKSRISIKLDKFSKLFNEYGDSISVEQLTGKGMTYVFPRLKINSVFVNKQICTLQIVIDAAYFVSIPKKTWTFELNKAF